MRGSTKAALILLVLAACSPSDSTPTTTSLVPTTTAPENTTTLAPSTTTAPAESTSTTGAFDVTVTAGVVDGPDRFEVVMGEVVEITVLTDVADEVHVHGYDLTFPTQPGVPTLVTFTADAQGIFEVELEAAEIPLFELVVTP